MTTKPLNHSRRAHSQPDKTLSDATYRIFDLPDEEDLDPEISTDEVKRRAAIAQDWITAATHIAVNADNDHALRLVRVLKNAGLTKPLGDTSSQYIVAPSVAEAPAIQPVLEDDLPTLQRNDNISRLTAVLSTFNPDVNIVSINHTVPISQTFRGIMFLHELSHAFDFSLESYDWEDDEIFSMYETITHMFQHDILAVIGSDIYEKFTSRYARELLLTHHFSDIAEVGKNKPTVYAYELDEIFGSAKSTFEKEVRQKTAWIHAVFRGIDRHHNNDMDAAFSAKVTFMSSLNVGTHYPANPTPT